MRKVLSIVIPGIVIGIILAFIVLGFSKTASKPESALLQPVSGSTTVADRSIREAQGAIENKPADSKGYNLLAAAFLQKSRETGDFSFNARAEESLKQSFRVDPDNFEAIKLNAAILLNYHRFADALRETQRAMAINTKDHEVLGAMVDAQVELGNYQEAVDAAQKMVDLRPDTAAYSRISYLRSLHGDPPGAIEMMRKAAESANPLNAESIAWCRVHLGDELMNTGKNAEAEKEYDHALYLFPDYHLALAAKARARYAAGDMDNAVKFYKQASERVPLPDYIAALGDLYAKLGRADEAKQQYDQVEFIEKNGPASGTYSRQLALFWADRDIHLDEALTVAQAERAARNDVYTDDALAWCFYKKGQFADAQTAMTEALRLGTRDPKMLYHAGMIAAANGDNKKGADYLKQTLDANPTFDILQANIAAEKLKSLKSSKV